MKIELAKSIFLYSLDTMKKILDLGKYKLGKDSEDFIYYKQQVMDYTYNNLKILFKQLEDAKIIERCPKKCNLRNGYSDCKCGGSGYINYEK
jgi:hypothetical protein